MERYNELKQIFQERKCFKLVCGAGNEDPEEVKRLTVIYTLAGVTMLDLSANVDVVIAAREGIEIARKMASALGKKIDTRPFLNVSIGLKGDPHVRKAQIDADTCTKCGACIHTCRQEAINEDFLVKAYRCIGCGECSLSCNYGAIDFIHKKADFNKTLPECFENGIETMELHAVTDDDEAVLKDWKLLNTIIEENYLSMCLDRSLLSNWHLIKRVREAYDITGDRLIIQADGDPMSGVGDDFNTTLQAIACADIVQKSGIPAMIFLSGGTNSKTGILARQCGVKANGVAIGSYARMIVKEYVKKDDLLSNMEALSKAVTIAEALIEKNIEAIRG
ncbi:MAG: 4Fe-4S binding protein [Candidatus Brocadiaceae bacterium]|nr:4Fe-4S binding protein [Candidatus Brocadiaceae bacterium]